MNTRQIAAVTVLLAAAVVPVANAVIINVPGDQPTTQAGIDAGGNGDEVVVAEGSFDGCGHLVQGVECVLFDPDGFPFDTLVIDIGPFGVGDYVCVVGDLELGCPNICLQGIGCVFDNSIVLCPGQGCPWDCADGGNGDVGITDFLKLLADWGLPSTCDFDGGGVGITDFLKLLANWGPCP